MNFFSIFAVLLSNFLRNFSVDCLFFVCFINLRYFHGKQEKYVEGNGRKGKVFMLYYDQFIFKSGYSPGIHEKVVGK